MPRQTCQVHNMKTTRHHAGLRHDFALFKRCHSDEYGVLLVCRLAFLRHADGRECVTCVMQGVFTQEKRQPRLVQALP